MKHYVKELTFAKEMLEMIPNAKELLEEEAKKLLLLDMERENLELVGEIEIKYSPGYVDLGSTKNIYAIAQFIEKEMS